MYMVPDIASVNKYLKGLLENLEIELILITKGARLPYVPTHRRSVWRLIKKNHPRGGFFDENECEINSESLDETL